MKRRRQEIKTDDQKQHLMNEINRENDRIESRNINIITKVENIMCPHQYVTDDPFQRNDIQGLLSDYQKLSKKWPAVPQFYAKTANGIITFYKQLRDDMLEEYLQKLYDNMIMETYEDVTQNSNYIDLIKIAEYDKDGDPRDMPIIKFKKDDVEMLRSKNHYPFIPCFSKMTIRINKRLYCVLQLNKITDNEIQMIASMYTGSKRTWIMLQKIAILYRLTNVPPNKVAMQFVMDDYISYVEMMSMYVDKMNWSKEQIQLWYDSFGIDDANKAVYVKMTPTKLIEDCPDEYKCLLESGFFQLLYDQSDLSTLTKNMYMKASIIEKGPAAIHLSNKEWRDKTFLSYINIISKINFMLYTEHPVIKSVDENGFTTYDFNNMIVKSKYPPIIPSETTLIQLQKYIT